MPLVVFAGQSNALGFGMSLATLPANLVTPNPNAYIFDGTWWGALRPGVNTGTPANPQAWGPEAEFARRYGVDHPGEVLLIIKNLDTVKGSTALAFDAGSLDWSPASAGEMFDRADATIDAARLAFTVATGQAAPAVSAVFWMQGEQDATAQAWANAYAGNLADLTAAIRADWMGDADGYIGLGRIGDAPVMPFNEAVRQAQWQVDQADPNLDSFKTIGFALQADGLHYATGGHVALGDGFYDAWAI